MWTTSVCTGSLILGAAGLLEDCRRRTLCSYAALAATERSRPSNAWSSRARSSPLRACRAASTWRCGSFIELFGVEMAQAIQLGIEYDPQRRRRRSAVEGAAEIKALVEGLVRAAEAEILARERSTAAGTGSRRRARGGGVALDG